MFLFCVQMYLPNEEAQKALQHFYLTQKTYLEVYISWVYSTCGYNIHDDLRHVN